MRHVVEFVGVTLLLVGFGCSKDTAVDASQTNNYSTRVNCEGPAADNVMCEAAPEAPPGPFACTGVVGAIACRMPNAKNSCQAVFACPSQTARGAGGPRKQRATTTVQADWCASTERAERHARTTSATWQG